jgi:hypothetical protein
MQEKRQSQSKWQRRAKKNSKEQEMLKINTEAQKSKKSSKSTQKLKRVRKAQNQHRSSKEQEKLKINTP